MLATYNLRLVVLSVVIAVIASYTALNLAGQVTVARRAVISGSLEARSPWNWHLVNALHRDVSLSTADTHGLRPLSCLNLDGGGELFAAPFVVERWVGFAGGGFMGLGIVSALHRHGCDAVKLSAQYDPNWLHSSITIGISASVIALWLAFHLSTETTVSGACGRSAVDHHGNAIAGCTSNGSVSFQPTDQSAAAAVP